MSQFFVEVVGSSSVFAPLFTNKIVDNDGYVYESNPYMPFEDYESAARDMFPSHGYGQVDILYLGDGYYICAECAFKAFMGADEPDSEAIANGDLSGAAYNVDTEDSRGVSCQSCDEYIIEPFCAGCWNDLSHDMVREPIFSEDSCGVNMCAGCMAEAVTKTGKLRYEVHTDRMSLSGTFEAQPTYRGPTWEEISAGQSELAADMIRHLDRSITEKGR